MEYNQLEGILEVVEVVHNIGPLEVEVALGLLVEVLETMRHRVSLLLWLQFSLQLEARHHLLLPQEFQDLLKETKHTGDQLTGELPGALCVLIGANVSAVSDVIGDDSFARTRTVVQFFYFC